MTQEIHPTAIVSSDAELGDGVSVGPYTIIAGKAKIGRGTKILSHVMIDGSVTVGENCTIYPFAGVGLPPQDLKYGGEPTSVIIGDGSIIREYATVHRASVGGDGATILGERCFLMAYGHVAHDCRIGNQVIMANATTLAGHVTVEDHVFIGGLVAIHQFTRIGAYAMVGGFSGIGQDIPPFTIASGARAKLFGLNTVGLKRNGFSDETIDILKKAYKILFREKRTLKDALAAIKSELPDTDEVRHLVRFIEENKRGICR